MLVHSRVTPSIKSAGTHLYTWVERGTVRVKCLAQEHKAESPAGARTRTARSGDKRTNREATAPPTYTTKYQKITSIVEFIMPNLVNPRSFMRTHCKLKNTGPQIYNLKIDNLGVPYF